MGLGVLYLLLITFCRYPKEGITKHKISNLNKCIIEAQQFISALNRQFWLAAVIGWASQILIKMVKKSKSELAETWAKNNNICGENPWWDKSKTYYNLTVEQILKMAKYIETKSRVSEQS